MEAIINIYDDAYTKNYRTLKISTSLTVEEVLGKDFDFINSVIMCNGCLVNKDYVIRDGDVVCARTYPASATAIAVTALVVAIVAVVAGVGLGLALHFNWFGIRDKLRNWLIGDEDDANNNGSENEKIPTIKGCRNRSMLGHPIPIVLGKTFITPYYCGNPYTSISGSDGEDQVYVASFCVGYAPLEVTHIKLGELVLSENTGKVENGIIPVSQAEGSAGRFIDNVELEIKSATLDVPTMYPKKIVQENLDFQLLYPEDTTPLKAERFSATFPMKVQVELSMNALYKVNDEGGHESATCSVILAISFDGGSTYIPFGAVSGASSSSEVSITNTAGTVIGTGTKSDITRNKNKQMRFVATRELTWAEAVALHEHGGDTAQIFLQKANTDATDGKTADGIYCTAIRTWVYDYEKSVSAGAFVAEDLIDDKRRQKVVCLTMRMKASNSFADLNGTINELSCTVTSKCRTWNGTSWSSTKTATTNPAAVALSLMQSPSLGSYAIPDEKIDLESFGELYEFAASHTGRRAGSETTVSMPFAVSGALTAQKKLLDSVNNVLNTARASLTMNGTMYSALIDKPRDYPVTVLNNHSFLKDGATNSKSFEELPDGYKVKFINERLGYDEDFIFVMVGNKTSSDPTAVIEESEVLWITNPDLVWQYTVYNHAKRKCRPEIWNRKIGLDGNLIEVGSLVSIQDDTILVGIGDGGEIKDVLLNSTNTAIVGVVIDGEIGVSDTTQTYGVKIVVADGIHDPTVLTKQVVITEEKYYDTFMFDVPISLDAEIKPSIGDILSFGVLDRITYDVLCSSKKDNGDGTYDMQFLPYDERVYTADTEGIPEFNSKMTTPPVMKETNQIPDDYVKKSDYISSVNSLLYGVISGDAAGIHEPDPVSNVVAKARRDQIDITWNFSGTGLSNTIDCFVVVITKKNGGIVTVRPADTKYSYLFTRHDANGNVIDGYPEASDLVDWTVTVTPVNVYGMSGTTSSAVHVNADADHYGTWRLGLPTIQEKIVTRTIILQLSAARTADNREIYGDVRYQIRVRRGSFDYTSVKYWMHDIQNGRYYYFVSDDSKLDETREKDNTWILVTEVQYEADKTLDSFGAFMSSSDSSPLHEYAYCANVQRISADTEWKCPTGNKDPYAHSENYYDESLEAQDNRYVVASSTYTQTMPLYFADEEHDVYNLMSTPYWFDVRCFNEAGTGSWYSGASNWSSGHEGKQCIALCTNLLDFVKANETAKSAVVEELSAISAHLGEITDGSLFGSLLNFWTLTTKRGATLPRDFIGAFRVGGTDEYLYVEPQLVDGQIVGYSITFKVGKFEISSEYSKLNGEFIVQTNEESLERTRITPTGTFFETRRLATDPEWRIIAKQDIGGILSSMVYSLGKLILGNAGVTERRRSGVDIGIPYISDVSRVYHFDTDELDQNGNTGLTKTVAAGGVAVLVDKDDGDSYGMDTKPAILAEAPYSEIGKSLYGQYTLEHSLGNGAAWTCDMWMQYVWAEGQELLRTECGDGVLRFENSPGEPNYNERLEDEPPYNTDTEIYEGAHPYNVARREGCRLRYAYSGSESTVYLDDEGVTPETGEWIHVAVVFDGTNVNFLISTDALVGRRAANYKKISFNAGGVGGNLTLNSSKNTFLLDELMIDVSTAELESLFSTCSDDRIPWGALDYEQDYLMLIKEEGSSFVTNVTFEDHLVLTDSEMSEIV